MRMRSFPGMLTCAVRLPRWIAWQIAALALLFCTIPSASHAVANPSRGALAGERFRVIVSTDVGGSDPDDFQSMVHYLVYADVFDTEGLISSPPKQGRKKHVLEAIAAYEKDYKNLKSHSSRFPSPHDLTSKGFSWNV